MLKVAKVKGNSMVPLFLNGDYVLGIRVFWPKSQLKIGDIVIVDTPIYGRIIKEIVHIDIDSSMVQLAGKNLESVSTKKMGNIPFQSIKWKVIKKLK